MKQVCEEKGSYRRMVEEVHNKWKGRSLFFVGDVKKARDLEYIFQISFARIGNITDVIHKSENVFVIFCRTFHEEDVQRIIIQNDLEYNKSYCYDEDLFDFLNHFAAEEFLSGDIAIWGIGSLSHYFLENFHKRSIQVKYFVCTEKKQNEMNGIPILTPSEIKEKNVKIVIAVNYHYFHEIEKKCKEIGIAESRYIHYSELMDNPGDLLRKTYYDDSYYHIDCLNRDKRAMVQLDGTINTCCFIFSEDASMGNINKNSFWEAWHSIKAQVNRLALLNHTFTFCNRIDCPYLAGLSADLDGGDYTKRYENGNSEYPDYITVSTSYTCNLRCTMCRNEVRIEPEEQVAERLEVVKEKLSMLPAKLMLTTTGEVFASRLTIELLKSGQMMRRGNIALFTNGTLLDKEMLDWILNHYELSALCISIDAATEDTYHKIRRGGDWKRLMNNIAYISEQRKLGKILYWDLEFVVQQKNVMEIEEFVEKAETWGVDAVGINGVINYGTYDIEEFENITVRRDGKIKPEFQKYFTEKLINNPKVIWGTFTNFLGTKHTIFDVFE